MDNSSLNYNELDGLISDKGITYNTKPYNNNSKDNLSEPSKKINKELYE